MASEPARREPTDPRGAGRREWVMAGLLLGCAVIVGFWVVMSRVARGPFDAFELTGENFGGFVPRPAGWTVTREEVPVSSIEPNIVAFKLWPRDRAAAGSVPGPVYVRLVHGYNMPDCMRIKGYEVELLRDTRRKDRRSTPPVEPGAGGSATVRAAQQRQCQVWRLTSNVDRVSVWVTAMLRAGDFRETSVDVRSMAFPRIGTPDDPRWAPRGITWESLRHPIRNLRRALRAKWNNSRCDPLTFLGLKQPAWASDEMLTLVAAYAGPSVAPDDEGRVAAYVSSAYEAAYREFVAWRARRRAASAGTRTRPDNG